VLEEGLVQPGDPIALLPPAPESRALVESQLLRIDPVERGASLTLWAAARAAGFDVRVLDDGDICAGASTELAEPAFNHAQGLRMMPQLLPDILAHFDRAGTAALIPHVAPAADDVPRHRIGVHAAATDELPAAKAPSSVEVVRANGALEAAWLDVYVGGMERAQAAAWRALLPHLLAEPHVHPFLARMDGEPAGVGLLHVRRHSGLLRGGLVAPAFRGRGVQRALIAARAAAAAELGCTLVASMAKVDSTSARNLAQMGLPRIDTHPVYEYLPA
jgi:GNAT superfamily N-acetyltransferase